MKLKQMLRTSLFSTLFALSGCTAWLWAGGNSSGFIPGSGNIVTTQHETKEIATDTVRAFGKTKNDQQIVMMGDTYWYFIDAKHTDALQKLLSTKLPKAFGTLRNEPFNVYLGTDTKAFGTGLFTLYYIPQNAKEIKTLTELGFASTKEKPTVYTKSYNLSGQIYKKAENINTEYQFETALPISIKVSKSETDIDGSLLATKVAATPLALAADIILLPAALIMLPFMD